MHTIMNTMVGDVIWKVRRDSLIICRAGVAGAELVQMQKHEPV